MTSRQSELGARVPFHRSIRFRLSLVIAGVILLAVMSVAGAASWREMQRGAAAKAMVLEQAAGGYAGAVAEPLAAGDATGAYQALRGVRDLPGVIHVELRDAAGNEFAQLGGGATIRRRTAELSALSGLELVQVDNASVSADIVKSGAVIGRLEILADITDLRRDLFAGLMWTLGAATIAILGGVALAQAMIARLTRPIRDLSAMMSDVGASQDFSRRMEPGKARDESAALGEAFNGMIGAINDRDARIAHHVETLEQTVEVRTHDLRLAKEDAEAANAAKSDFLATMSHEIRTPMNGMMVMAEMLAAADLSARHRRYAEIISRSGSSLLTIINDILDLSKIEAGKLDLESVPFSPDALVEDVAALFWERARSKGLELAVYMSPDVPQQIIGDPTRFNQVVTNLVNNALKFTETGGVAILVTAKAEGGRCRLNVAVRDTGIGIPQEKIGTIFEAFGQADQSTTRKFGGTGLGLTVCKRLVDAMEGEIIVTSEVGKGSTFTVSAPFAVELAAPAMPAAGGLKFAIAQDAGLGAKCLATLLRDAGCAVRRVGSPDDALMGELVLATSDRIVAAPASGALAICLSDIGDARADGLLRSRAAVDLLAMPVGRRALWELLERATRFAFRGPDALNGGGALVEKESFAGLRVLAVDDNAVNREVLREALLTLDVEADFVANGEEAVRAAKAKRYDAIFMDGSMPVMDGFTATSLIRAYETSTGVGRARVIALTAQVRGADAEAWEKAGADQHMTKPFTASRLVEALKVAQGRAASAPAGQAEPVAPEAPAPAKARPVFDEDAIATMDAVSQRSGRDLVAKVWKLFLSQAPLAVDRINALAAAQPVDNADLAKQAHSLKSMCLSSGAARMAECCEIIEATAKAGRADLALPRAADLPDMLATTSREMQDRLATRTAPVKKQA
jgi:signal transduction histidine kinase/CheY-like chemotaxis protein/HPt (histidine-containing phosphotransfer) domain-containing protein